MGWKERPEVQEGSGGAGEEGMRGERREIKRDVQPGVSGIIVVSS